MSFFGKTKKPGKPSIEEEKEFIIWMVKYYEAPDMKLFKEFFKNKKLDSVIESLANDIIEVLNKYSNGMALLDFLSEVNEGYGKVRSMTKKYGGFWMSLIEIQVAFLDLLGKMVTLPYFVKYKHGVNIPLGDFQLPEYNEL